jgi:phage gp46-like protein
METMDQYTGDPLLTDLGNGGDLDIRDGQPVMDKGLINSAYLSHFIEPEWWGWSSDPENKQVINSGNLMAMTERATLTPAILNDAVAAAKKDLSWMISDGVAKSIECSGSIIGLGLMGLVDTITEMDGTVQEARWRLNWAAMKESVS